MILSAHQPIFLPYLGFFSKVKQADVLVLMDQYPVNFKDQNKFDNRNKIRTATTQGYQWLTIPCVHTPEQQRFCDVQIDHSQQWQRKLFRAIEVAYSKAPYYGSFGWLLRRWLEHDTESLAEYNIHLIKQLVKYLGIRAYLPRQSILRQELTGNASEKLVQLCKLYKVQNFLFGADGKQYADLELFAKEGITVQFQHYIHPTYRQAYQPFISHLSIIDAIFNCGKTKVKEMI